jgi:ketosteroid isomerase-like protein
VVQIPGFGGQGAKKNTVAAQPVVLKALAKLVYDFESQGDEATVDELLEAMTDPAVFFDAVGDQDKLRRNVQAMMDSCSRFIDRNEASGQHMIDVVPTSQYVIRPSAA